MTFATSAICWVVAVAISVAVARLVDRIATHEHQAGGHPNGRCVICGASPAPEGGTR